MMRAFGFNCANLEIMASEPNSGEALLTTAPISNPATVKAKASIPIGRTETMESPS